MECTKSVPETTRLGAEFLGSFLVVFVVCSNYSAAYSPNHAKHSSSALAVFAPTSIACVYMAMGYALKNVSGGILNPAVTVSLMLQRTLGKLEGLKMCAAQFAGGAAAGFATLFLYGWQPDANIVGPRSAGFFVGAPLVEALYTCLLCFVYLNVNRDVLRKKREAEPSPPSDKSFYALAVGFVYIAGGVGGRYVSGGSFNPAVSVGVNFMGPNWKVITLPIYIGAQCVGAILAVLLFYIVRKDWYVTEDRAENKGEEAVEKAMQFGFEKLTSVVDAEDTCEFIGTLFVSLTISLNQIAQSTAIEDNDTANVNAAAGKVWSSAACVICLMYALADCSGGLFNPAITLAYAVRFYNTGEGLNDKGKCDSIEGTPARLCDAKLSATETLKYLVFQLLGGAAGTGLTILVWLASGKWPVAAIQPGTYEEDKDDTVATENYTQWQAMFAEFYGTFLICYVMVVVMLSKRGSVTQFGPFAVGGCVIAAGYAFGTLSGGFFNPAIVLGDAVGSKFQVVYTLPPLLYVSGQLLGGMLAGAVFRLFTHKEEVGSSGGAQTSMKQQLIPVLP